MANDVYQLNIIASVANEFCETVLHYVSSGINSTTPGSDALAICNAWQAGVEVNWLGVLGNDYLLGGYKCKRVNNTGGPSATLVRPAPFGTFSAASIVSGQGAVLTAGYYDSVAPKPRWKTTRIFIPGMPEGAYVEGEIQGAYSAALAVAAGSIDAGLHAAGNTYQYCAYRRASGTVYTTNSLKIGVVVGTQRRRYKPAL